MDWIGMTCWAVLGVAGLVTLWALFWDRPRGRLRCRKCAYDMSGGGLTCPECGREHESESSLRVTRRKWKTAVWGIVVLCCSGHILREESRIREEGAIGAVPTAVLVLIANPQEYLNEFIGISTSPVTLVNQALTNRLTLNDACYYSRRSWMYRLAVVYRGSLDRLDQVVGQYNLSDIAPLYEITYDNSATCFSPGITMRYEKYFRNDRAVRLIELIEEIVQFEEWVDNGGDNASYLHIGDQLLVVAPQDIQDEVQERFAELRKNRWTLGQPNLSIPETDQRCLVVYEIPEFPGLGELDLWSRMYFLQEKIEQSVEPHLWQPDGYGAARIYMEDSGFTVWTTPAHHREIMVFLNAE